jgi:PKD repeat protein
LQFIFAEAAWNEITRPAGCVRKLPLAFFLFHFSMFKSLPSLRAALLSGSFFMAVASPVAAQTPAGVSRAYPEHRSGFRCAFDSAQQAAFARQPGAEARYRNFLQEATHLSAADQARLLAAPDVTVPVVMHIIHTGGTDNISDAQVNDAMRIINEDFSKRNRDTADVIIPFQSRYANVGFKFRLAKLDPNGNCTTGITRTYSTDTNIGDDRVKTDAWDQNRYLNIWICTNANGAGGYAYLPCTGGGGDGIVIRAAQFGSIGQSGGSNAAVRSLTHEIGHFFGLPHTWGGSNTPGLASNCGIDDGIADTPNTIGIQGGCNLTFSPCTDAAGRPILSNVQNYMDYASCTRMFTTDQRSVMRASLQLGCRAQMTTLANLLATGTNDGFGGGPCAPVVTFRPSATKICEGNTITFNDYSYNADLTAAGTVYSWSFPGGTPATSSQRNPTVTYATGGVYDVTLTITSAGGSSTSSRTQLIQVVGANSGLQAPLAESFENAAFPDNFPTPDLRNWGYSSTSSVGLAFLRRPSSPGGLVVSDGAACLTFRSNVLPSGSTSWLTSPNINLSSFSAANPPVLSFDRAYAQRTTTVSENLQVQFSTDCGVTWTTAASYFSAALNTMGTARIDGFSPTAATDWQPLRVSIDPSFIGPRFQVRFQLNSRSGNPLFLDHVGLSLPTATRAADAARYDLRLYPNPLTAETAVYLTLPAPATVQLRLTDVLGREVLAPAPTRLGAGPQHLLLPQAHLAPGLYLVQVLTEGQTLSTKLVVR